MCKETTTRSHSASNNAVSSYEFNAVVGLDLKFIKDLDDKSYVVLNTLDLATTFSIAVIVADKKPKTIAEAFRTHWMTWASTPEKVVLDQGTEFQKEFEDMLTDLGIRSRLAAVEAPWQQGMVESVEHLPFLFLTSVSE